MKTKPEEIKQSCPECHKNHIVSWGDNVTIKDGKKPRLKCQDCGKTFYKKVKSEETEIG